MIVLALHDNNNRLIICNGYKDHDYIRAWPCWVAS